MRIKTRHSNWTPPNNATGLHPSTGSSLVKEHNVGRLGFVRLRTLLDLTQVLWIADKQPKNLKLRRFHSYRAGNQAGVMFGERII